MRKFFISLCATVLSGMAFGQVGQWNGTGYDYSANNPSLGTGYTYQQPNYGYNPNASTGFGSNGPISDSMGNMYTPDGSGGYMDSRGVTFRPDGMGGYQGSDGRHLTNNGYGYSVTGGYYGYDPATAYLGSLAAADRLSVTLGLPPGTIGVGSLGGYRSHRSRTVDPLAYQKQNPCYCGLHNGYCMVFRRGSQRPLDAFAANSCSISDCQQRFAPILNGACGRYWKVWPTK